MKNTYVIGLSPIQLLNIQEHLDYDKEEFIIWRVMYGVPFEEATMIVGLGEAKRVRQEIQDRYDEILVMNSSVLGSILDGNDFDPMQLHIYRVVLREVE